MTRDRFFAYYNKGIYYEGLVEGLGYVTWRSTKEAYLMNKAGTVTLYAPGKVGTIIPLKPKHNDATNTQAQVLSPSLPSQHTVNENSQQMLDWKYNQDQKLAQMFADKMLYNDLPKLNYWVATGMTLAETAGHAKIASALSLSASTVSKAFKIGGSATFVLGVGLDMASYSDNRISGKKLALNIGVSTVAFGIGYWFSGPLGGTISAYYYGVDLYYPGGWVGYIEDRTEFETESPFIYNINKY
ncbi:MAG: hypothetical protein RL662_1752 [Bacteroidota bacterium]|jgi:hypothetical protein